MLNVNDLKQLIYNGASLDASLNKTTLKEGFMVSLLGYEKTFTPEQTTDIYNTILQYQKLIKNNKYKYIGLWYNDGLVYVDISQHYKNKKDAFKTGVKNRQLAIFDLKNNCDIKLLKTTYILYQYNKVKNDVKYIKEYYDIDDIKNDFKMDNHNLHHFIYNTLTDTPPTQLLKDRFIIIRDAIYYKDFIEMLEA